MENFSLFEGDLLSRFFLRFGIRNKGIFSLMARVLFLWLLTAFPTALFAWCQNLTFNQYRAMNFFGDVSAFGQALLGYPLFVIAEWIIGEKTRSAAHHFSQTGVVKPDQTEQLDIYHRKIARLRRSWIPETLCFVLGFIFALMWLYEETHNATDTWHAIGAPLIQTPTFAGWWVALVGIPVFNFWWLRWLWKIYLWCWYLYKVSRLRLRLIATHPDKTGGLGFLSEAQASFAVVIFAFGVGIVAPLISYKIEIENADLFSFSLAGPLFGFIIGAPLLFTLPLLAFTKQLYRAKKRAVEAFQDRSNEIALLFESKWLHAEKVENESDPFGPYMSGMNNLHNVFARIEEMRVVPFDLRSFSQLIGSTVGSLLPLILKLANLPEPTKHILEIIKPFIPGGGGGGH